VSPAWAIDTPRAGEVVRGRAIAGRVPRVRLGDTRRGHRLDRGRHVLDRDGVLYRGRCVASAETRGVELGGVALHRPTELTDPHPTSRGVEPSTGEVGANVRSMLRRANSQVKRNFARRPPMSRGTS
jgi:hypothetical protein